MKYGNLGLFSSEMVPAVNYPMIIYGRRTKICVTPPHLSNCVPTVYLCKELIGVSVSEPSTGVPRDLFSIGINLKVRKHYGASVSVDRASVSHDKICALSLSL